MKRILAVMLGLLITGALYGLTVETLIDFDQTGNKQKLEEAQNDTNFGGGEITNEGEVSLESLYNGEWIVHLNSSAQTIANRRVSFCTNVKTKGTDKSLSPNGEEWNVLGIRVHFPEPAWNSFALIKPAYELEFFGGPSGKKYTEGRGVIRNIGAIKRMTSWACGRNFNIAYYVNIRDYKERDTSYLMGSLYFRGWRNLEWVNPNYLLDVRDRVLSREPLYPKSQPAIKLQSLQFYRPREVVGGDFVTYIRDVEVEFEEAVPPTEEFEFDVDDESVWKILETRNEIKKRAEMKKIREIKELRDLERVRMKRNQEEGGEDTAGGGTAAPATPGTTAPTTP